jgi:hypothetical protein
LVDAKQFLACGSSRSVWPSWLDEEELALSELVEKAQLEMKAEAEARREATGKPGDPLEYPFPPSMIGGKPALTVATLDAHRSSMTPLSEELYEAATAALNAHKEKAKKLRSAGDGLGTAWRDGRLHLHGRSGDGKYELIDPRIIHLGDVELRDVGDEVTEMRTDLFVIKRKGYSTEERLYEDVVLERAELIALAQLSGGNTVNETPAAEPAGTQLPSLSPDGMPDLADPKVNPAKATNSGVGSVPRAKRARAYAQKIVLQAIAGLGLEQTAPELPDKELQHKIEPWCSDQGKETPCTKTIRRALGKELIRPRKNRLLEDAAS